MIPAEKEREKLIVLLICFLFINVGSIPIIVEIPAKKVTNKENIVLFIVKYMIII